MFDFLFKKEPLKVGELAPDFSLPSQNGNVIRLSQFRERTCVVLYFYPKDNTYGCIAESCDFRDSYEIFKESKVEVIGISSDSPSSHRNFAEKYKLPFILLSDEKNEVRKLYRVPPTMGVIPGRVTFVIDKQGIIRHVFSSQFNPKSHVEEALRIIKESNS
ncbi:MAG: peroxiredoxin [Elusimicrobiota bacterium]